MNTLQQLERDAGIIFMSGGKKLMNEQVQAALAMDAQPALTTAGNSGIPAWMLTYVDPKADRSRPAADEGRADFRRSEKRRLDD